MFSLAPSRLHSCTHVSLLFCVTFSIPLDLEVFEDTAVEICARKVASISGDVRRALQIARRAAEICDRENRQRKAAAAGGGRGSGASTSKKSKKRRTSVNGDTHVSIEHIQKAHKELDSTPCVLAIKHTAVLERLFLAAVVLKLRATGVESVPFQDVALRFEQLCRTQMGITFASERPSLSEVRNMCHRLARMRLLVLEDGTQLGEYEPSVRMNVLVDDVIWAIQHASDADGVAASIAQLIA